MGNEESISNRITGEEREGEMKRKGEEERRFRG